MGLPAAKQFFPRYAGLKVRRLSEVLGRRFDLEIAGRDVAVFAITHPSPLARGPGRAELYEHVGSEIAALLRPSD